MDSFTPEIPNKFYILLTVYLVTNSC